MINAIARISGLIFLINVFIGGGLTVLPKPWLGRRTPDATHAHLVHFRNGPDYYFGSFWVIYDKWMVWIWLGSLVMFVLAYLQSNDEPQDRDPSPKDDLNR